jgi:hypothetical protein
MKLVVYLCGKESDIARTSCNKNVDIKFSAHDTFLK